MAADQIDTSALGAIHDAQVDYYGQRTALASGDSCVYVFEAEGQNKPSACLKGHEGAVWKVAWAHPKFGMNRSSVLASCGFDMKVIIWKETSANQWQIAHCDTSHTASVNSIAFCPWEFGLRLACASSDGTASVLTHNPQDSSWHRASFQAHACGAQSVTWAPASPTAAVHELRMSTGGCDNDVKIWCLENDSWTQERPPLAMAHTDWIRAVAWRPDEVRVLASGGWDKSVVIWEQASTGSPSGSRAPSGGERYWRQAARLQMAAKIEALAWSETGGVLAVSCGDGDSKLYKENDGEYVEVATVSEAGLQDIPNSLYSSSIAAVQGGGTPKVSLETISPGDGRTFPKVGDTLLMHYTGKIAADGREFDSSHKRNAPFQFQIGLGKVIDGWDQGVIQMSLGQKTLLRVPYALGYGEEGAGEGVIPPKADLLFEVELLKIN